MSKKRTDKKLFDDFAPVSTKKWVDKVNADLKGVDYRKRLFWTSPEGIEIKPFYRSEDIKKTDYLNALPGDFPFTRGTKTNNTPLLRQDIFIKDIDEANRKSLDILMKGVNSLGFIFSSNYIARVADIEKLMENIFADSVEINFMIGTGSHKVISVYEELVKKYNRDPQSIEASVDFDPFYAITYRGKFCQTEEYAFKHAHQILDAADFLPKLKTFSVNGLGLRNSGANIVQELTYCLSMGSEYLIRLTDSGASVDDIAPRIKFNFGVGSNYFMEIAKFRAARTLWAKIVNAFGPENTDITKMCIHATNISFNKTIYDAHVNLLRTTTETLSALIAGVDSFTVVPYNAHFEWPTEFSERIARNQQLLITEESFIDKVADPSAGSYYIESLTDEIINKTWEQFLKIDQTGGYIKALKEGIIQSEIETTAKERLKFAASRKESYTGTNEFPNFNERIEKEMNPEIFREFDQTEKGAKFNTLKQFRVSQSFEFLRYKTDIYAQKNKRPKVFLLTIGDLAMRKARSQFASNFFAVAGFEIIDSNGFASISEGIKAAQKYDSDIVVLCSSDKEYGYYALEFAHQTSKDFIGVLAGYPKEIIGKLDDVGFSNYIHIKSNILNVLQKYQKQLGIE
jgi:methylmalonyl-CoA mutase